MNHKSILKSTTPIFFILIHSILCAQTVYEVTNLNNAGSGSFRQAMINANANPGLDTINFRVTGTLNITTTENDLFINNLPNIRSAVVINGNGVRLTNSIQGRFFQVDTAATIRDLMFDGGQSTFTELSTAGAVFVSGGVDEIIFENCVFENNLANNTGGALRIVGAHAQFVNCNFVNNIAGDGHTISCTNGCEISFVSTVANVLLRGDTELLINPPLEIPTSRIWTVFVEP